MVNNSLLDQNDGLQPGLFFFFFPNLHFLGISLKLPQGHKLVVSKEFSDKNRLTWLMCSHDGFKCLRF